MSDPEVLASPRRVPLSAWLYSGHVWTVFTLSHPEYYQLAEYRAAEYRRPPAARLHQLPWYAQDEMVLQQHLSQQLRLVTNCALKELKLPDFSATRADERKQLVHYLDHVMSLGLEKCTDLIALDRTLPSKLSPVDRELLEALYQEPSAVPLDRLLGHLALQE